MLMLRLTSLYLTDVSSFEFSDKILESIYTTNEFYTNPLLE